MMAQPPKRPGDPAPSVLEQLNDALQVVVLLAQRLTVSTKQQAKDAGDCLAATERSIAIVRTAARLERERQADNKKGGA